MRIGIYLYPEVEVLDVAGPFEVFTTANRLALRQQQPAPFDVCFIANTPGPIAARAGFLMQASAGVANCPALDLLVLPGGYHLDAMRDPLLLQFIRQQAQQVAVIACVCTGIFLYASAQPDLVATVTTHWEDQADLAALFPALQVLPMRRYVEDAQQQPTLWSSGGISAGIDLSLELVARYADDALAHATAQQMEFRWLRH